MRLGQPSESRLGAVERQHGLGIAMIGGLLGLVARMAWWMLRHPRATAAALIVVLLGKVASEVDAWVTYTVIAIVIASLAGWWLFGRDSFHRHLTWRMRAWWRMKRNYQKNWQPALVTSGLTFTHQEVEYVPRLVAVSCEPCWDVVTLQMLPGQTLADYTCRADRLAQSFGFADCRVHAAAEDVRRVELWFITTDPLAEPVAPFPPADLADLRGVPVAVDERGTVWGMPLLGSHVLIAGATGSGKGSVIWSLIAGLTPAIDHRIAAVWAIDPKGGIELAFGAPLFDQWAYGDTTTAEAASAWQTHIADLLDDAVAIMQQRMSRLRGVTRLHTPTPDEPLIVIIVDELASLTAFVTDRALKNRIAAALSLLLSQGRAAAVAVVAATQDARKENLTLRDLFPARIALRTSEAEQADMILGRGARDRGALTDQIPAAMPGVGYVAIDGVPEMVRVRFTHVTDDHIAALVSAVTQEPEATPAPPPGVDDNQHPGWAEGDHQQPHAA